MEKQSIRPLGKNVLIKALEPDTKTKAGIFLPQTAEAERPQEGKVIAIGDDKEIKVRKNQHVIFSRYGGTEVKIGSSEYLIIKNEDILAVIG